MAAFIAGNLAVPWLARDLYPFSVFPMFSARPALVSRVTVTDPDGRVLDPAIFETWTLGVSNASPRTGFAVTSLDPGDRRLEEAEVRAHVQRVFREREIALPFVAVEQTVAFIGTSGNVVHETSRWRVER